MNVMIQLPTGAWQYVKMREDGLTYSIYSTDALQGENSLLECKKLFPMFNFKLEV